jgi:hypothetical protein
MNNEKTKPVDEVKFGLIAASIWKNKSKTGTHYNVTISRLYKSGQSWKRSESFGRDDLLTAAKVLELAHTRIFELSKESKE